MSIKEVIEKDLEEGKKIEDSLSENNIRVEDFILGLLKENRDINKRVEAIERYVNNWIEATMTPW